MLKKFLALFGTLFLAAGLSVIAVAAPASATHPVVTGSAVCNPATGLYDITWTVTGDPGFPDATGEIDSQTQPTTPTLVGLTVKGTGSQQGVQAGVGPGTYSQKVVVDWGNHNADHTFEVVIPKTPACVKDDKPKCIPTNLVTYTYDAKTNSGVITVPKVDGSTGELCDDFFVTATSWKFVNKTGWPQSLDQTQFLGPISKTGTYPYKADVACGQGDIYASFTEQPTPPAVLNGASNPWPEHFLHEMGFKGPKPTHTVQDAKCQETKPTVDYRLGACYPNGQFSSANLFLVFDNTASTVPVTFSVPNAPDVTSPVNPTPSIVRVVPAGQKIEVETSPIWQNGGSYTVQMSGVPSVTIPDADITVKPFVGCLTVKPGDPTSTGETCVAGSTKPLGGSITVGFETGLQYSIDGPGTAHDFVVVNQKTTTGLPAGDYVVKVVALPGYVLTGATSWPLTVKIAAATCPLPAVLASTGSSPALGLGIVGGLLVLGGLGFALVRKRIAAGRHTA